MIKKLLTLLLAVLMLLSLTSCGFMGGGDETAADSDEESKEYDKGYDEEFEIFVNGSGEWTPFPGKSGVEFEVSNEYAVSCQTTPSTISFTGKQVGKSVITATLDGEVKKALVEVKQMVAKDEDDDDGEDVVIDYAYTPPMDNYYLRYEDKSSGDVEACGRIGEVYAESYSCSAFSYNHYYSDETKMMYEYDPSAQSWKTYMDGPHDAMRVYDEFLEEKAENAAGHDSGLIIDSFESVFMRYFRQYGFDESRLTEYYVGTETVLGVECWVFDAKGLNAISTKYWVDKSNGCTLKMVNGDEEMVLTHYDLNYTEWSSDLMP